MRPARLADERGFTLIELPVASLIIAIRAAIAIPSFLNQTGTASDAGAKELAHTAQIAMETCATANDDISNTANCHAAAKLQGVESTIPIASSGGNARLGSVATPATGGYTVTTSSSTGDPLQHPTPFDGRPDPDPHALRDGDRLPGQLELVSRRRAAPGGG